MANQGEFAAGGVTRVTQLPTPVAGLRGEIFYLSQVDGDFDPGLYVVRETELEWVSVGGGGIGQVYITDATPISLKNTSNKLTIADGYILTKFRSDHQIVNIHVLALPGPSGYKPAAKVNGVSIINFAREGGGPEWNGSAQITLPLIPLYPETGTIVVDHADGAKAMVTYELKLAPDVQSVVFSGSYPGSQTEVKTSQTFNIDVTTNVPMAGIRVEIYGVRTSSTQIIPITGGASTSGTYAVTIQNAHSSVSGQSYGVRVTAYDDDNSFGLTGTSDSSGSVNGVNVITVNNMVPSGSITVTSYSNGYAALANGDTVNLVISAANYSDATITSPTNELSVTSTTLGSSTAAYLSGTYNIATNNIRLQLIRAANATTATIEQQVKIAETLPSVSISTASRLRSGGNQGTAVQNHTVTVTSTQQLFLAPTLVASSGVFQGAAFAGGPSSWTRGLQITDNSVKGANTFSSLVAVNLAGKQQININSGASYTVGGFVSRTLTVATPFSRTTAVGTIVTDTTKLRCSNLSKGASGSLNFTFKALTAGVAPTGSDDEINRYTIVDSATGFYSASGNTWYNLDAANANSNSTGGLQLELEELI